MEPIIHILGWFIIAGVIILAICIVLAILYSR